MLFDRPEAMKFSFVINFLYTRKLGLSVITAVAYDDGMTP